MPFKIIRIKTKSLWELLFPLDAKNKSVIVFFKRFVIFFFLENITIYDKS